MQSLLSKSKKTQDNEALGKITGNLEKVKLQTEELLNNASDSMDLIDETKT